MIVFNAKLLILKSFFFGDSLVSNDGFALYLTNFWQVCAPRFVTTCEECIDQYQDKNQEPFFAAMHGLCYWTANTIQNEATKLQQVVNITKDQLINDILVWTIAKDKRTGQIISSYNQKRNGTNVEKLKQNTKSNAKQQRKKNDTIDEYQIRPKNHFYAEQGFSVHLTGNNEEILMGALYIDI